MKCPKCEGISLSGFGLTEVDGQLIKTDYSCPRCHGTGEVPDAPRFKTGDRVTVEGEVVRARGDEIHIRISNGYWEHVILMFGSGVHPMPEEGEI